MQVKIHKLTTVICLLLVGLLFCIPSITCKKSNSTANAPSQGDSLSFIILGDWGRNGKRYQKAVAEQMAVYAKKFHVQFVITAGDNFYERGVSSVNDPQWKASFENIYDQSSLSIPWYATLGNHDYGLNPQAQVEYSLISNRWKMPARYYTLTKNIDNTHTVLFAFTDTSPFVSEYYNQSMADLQKQDTAAQTTWLRQTLTASKDTWKIAIGHHPVYSAGRHGNTPELIDRFKPILLQSKTDFYICGHDHDLQYIVEPNESVRYLISGGGSEKTSIVANPDNLFEASSAGFLVMSVYPDKANFYFYNEKGDLLYTQRVTK